MTPEKLQALARETLAGGIREIQEGGDLMQRFYLVKRDGGMEFWLADSSVTNEENAKRGLAAKLRERVASGEIEAVLMLSDSYVATNISPENDAIRRRLRMTVKEAEAYGLCKTREAVIIHCESPILAVSGRQFYKRVNGKIELEGEMQIKTDVDGALRVHASRFTQWFPAQAGRA